MQKDKLKIEQREPHYQPEVNSGATEVQAVPIPHVEPVVFTR